MPSKLRAGLFAVGMCGCMSATTLGQTNSAFYDRATSTIRQVFDDPLRCVPAEHVKQKWVEWSKCVASGAERFSRLFDYSPGVVTLVTDYSNRVQVLGQMIEDRILTRDDALKEISAERERLVKAITPVLQDRVYREAVGQK